jgi:hypothetical protein
MDSGVVPEDGNLLVAVPSYKTLQEFKNIFLLEIRIGSMCIDSTSLRDCRDHNRLDIFERLLNQLDV